jgi:hypothetical protein
VSDLRGPAAVIRRIVDGEADDPPSEPLRRAIRDARVELRLDRGDRRGRGWLGPAGAVIEHPLPDGRARLVTVSPPLLIDALVRLNDVGPRPRPPDVRIAVSPAALAEGLATRDPARARLDDRDQAAAFGALLAGLREHWRVAARWEPADGALAGRALEVLDTDGGYWIVVPDDPTVELWPSTPTAVFRALCGLFPRTTEVRP